MTYTTLSPIFGLVWQKICMFGPLILTKYYSCQLGLFPFRIPKFIFSAKRSTLVNASMWSSLKNTRDEHPREQTSKLFKQWTKQSCFFQNSGGNAVVAQARVQYQFASSEIEIWESNHTNQILVNCTKIRKLLLCLHKQTKIFSWCSLYIIEQKI